jgi:hypothetical protein
MPCARSNGIGPLRASASAIAAASLAVKFNGGRVCEGSIV